MMKLLLKYLKFVKQNAAKYLKYSVPFDLYHLEPIPRLLDLEKHSELLFQIYEIFRIMYEMNDERYIKHSLALILTFTTISPNLGTIQMGILMHSVCFL